MEENSTGEGPGNQNGEGPKVDVNEVLKRLEQLESTNKRLLEESKGHKREASDYKSKLEQFEKSKLDQSGDEKAQLEFERKQRERFEKENKALKNKTLEQNVRMTVAKFAKDVHNLEDLLNQPKFKKILTDGIDPENLTLDEEAAKDFVNKVLDEKPYLKRNLHQPGVDKTKPNINGITPKSIKNLSDAELNKLIYGE
jgi:hypothetical protein